MKSMTGFGRGESSHAGVRIAVELNSVNRKQVEVALNLPAELDSLEAQVRKTVLKSVARGRVSGRATLQKASQQTASQLRINRAAARTYEKEMRKLSNELKLTSQSPLDTLLRLPGVLETGNEQEDLRVFEAPLIKALSKALRALIKMRTREGRHLEKDLKQRITLCKRAAAKIKKRTPAVIRRYRQQLIARIGDAGFKPPAPDDDRLLREIVYFTDRSDISEELIRLQSHFDQFGDCLTSNEPIGRKLDFLAQEMHREVNTIGSKGNDSLISMEVVTLKTELEKIREQVQNVE